MDDVIDAPLLDLKDVVNRDPEIMGGEPVFMGTRVPVQALVDHLVGGETIDDFLDGFPTVTREQAISFIEHGVRLVLVETDQLRVAAAE